MFYDISSRKASLSQLRDDRILAFANNSVKRVKTAPSKVSPINARSEKGP